jgi:hypothetical protein
VALLAVLAARLVRLQWVRATTATLAPIS